MRWINWISGLLIGCKGKKSMAKIALDDFNGKLFEFDLNDLIYINYDPASKSILVCLKNCPPKYLPLTSGNISYLRVWTPFQEIQLNKNLKNAEKDFLDSLPDNKI
jgi:hypothetical protein